jgi:hypothetical protein
MSFFFLIFRVFISRICSFSLSDEIFCVFIHLNNFLSWKY